MQGREEAAQLTPFLTGLFKAVESSPGAALVFTLAIGKARAPPTPTARRTSSSPHKLAEAESVAARKATLLDPTSEQETVQVLRRRLFRASTRRRRRGRRRLPGPLEPKRAGDLPSQRINEDRAGGFWPGYPFHPALMDVLTDKLATLANFQRVRGMLRLVTQTVGASVAGEAA